MWVRGCESGVGGHRRSAVFVGLVFEFFVFVGLGLDRVRVGRGGREHNRADRGSRSESKAQRQGIHDGGRFQRFRLAAFKGFSGQYPLVFFVVWLLLEKSHASIVNPRTVRWPNSHGIDRMAAG